MTEETRSWPIKFRMKWTGKIPRTKDNRIADWTYDELGMHELGKNRKK